jgi:phosphate transport system permease protein
MISRMARRRAKNAIWKALCCVAATIATLPMVAVLVYVGIRGAPAMSWAFFTERTKPVGEPDAGMGNAIVGSLVLILLASLVGVPLGVLGGVSLARARGSRWTFWVRFAADVLQGVPSIVIGVVAYSLLVVPMGNFSALSGGLALALIMLPTVVRTTEEMIRLVPRPLAEAASGLGAPDWRTTTFVLLRGARVGIITGIILALARVAGETAPLLFTAFNSAYWPVDLQQPLATLPGQAAAALNQPIASLPVLIYNYAISPFEELHQRAWAASLALVFMVLFASIATRLATRGRYEIVQ